MRFQLFTIVFSLAMIKWDIGMGNLAPQYPRDITEDLAELDACCGGPIGVMRQVGRSLFDAEEADAFDKLNHCDVDFDALYGTRESEVSYLLSDGFMKVLDLAETCLNLMLKNGMQVDRERSYVTFPVEE